MPISAAHREGRAGRRSNIQMGLLTSAPGRRGAKASRVQFEEDPWAPLMPGGSEAEDETDDEPYESKPRGTMRSRSSGGAGERPSIFGGSGSNRAERGTAIGREMRPGAPARSDANTLIQLEMLKALKKITRGERDSSSDDEVAVTSSRRVGTEGLHRLLRRIRQHPERIVDDYVDMLRERLGVTDRRQVWHPRDYSRKLLGRFGRMKGL